MSDNESDYYSDADSVSNDSDTEEIKVNTPKATSTITPKNIETYDDSEIEESESDSENESNNDISDEEIQDGGGVDEDEEEVENVSDEEKEEENDNNDDTVNKKIPKSKKPDIDINDDEDDDEYDDNYLQKFDAEINKNYVNTFHPECLIHNYDEISKLTKVIRNEDNIIVDPYHRTIPFLTKYEKARVLGQRSKQIETGARPLVKVPENIIDGYIIAELELKEKKIPFIIRRPLPSGSCEYWNIRDLEMIGY